jgi:hypothetical protein
MTSVPARLEFRNEHQSGKRLVFNEKDCHGCVAGWGPKKPPQAICRGTEIGWVALAVGSHRHRITPIRNVLGHIEILF